MAETKSSLLKNAINGGLLLGLISIVFSVILYVLDIVPVGITKGLVMLVISLLIYFFVIFYTSKSYRNNVLGGYISFGQAFIFGLLVAIFAAILTAIYNYIFYALIDPEYAARVASLTKDWTETFMESKGVPEATIAEALDKIDEKIVTPLKSVRQALIGGTIFGAIVSLITSAIVKKKKDIKEYRACVSYHYRSSGFFPLLTFFLDIFKSQKKKSIRKPDRLFF